MCKKVGKPSESSAAALAKLFGSTATAGPSRKRSFDPMSECVVASQRAKKKATVPKGRLHSKLKDSGRIVKLQFKRCMKASQVRSIVSSGFSEFKGIEGAHYLRCGQDNIMVVNENQELDGDDIIDLAGQGSLYLTQKRVNVSDITLLNTMKCLMVFP